MLNSINRKSQEISVGATIWSSDSFNNKNWKTILKGIKVRRIKFRDFRKLQIREAGRRVSAFVPRSWSSLSDGDVQFIRLNF